MPDLVCEVGVGGGHVGFGAGFLEMGVVFGRVLDFGGAVESEGGWHEDQDAPLAKQRRLADFDELAVVEGLRLEGCDDGVDEGNLDFWVVFFMVKV